MKSDTTTIQVTTEVWQELNSRKRPNDSFDDVLRRELGIVSDSGRSEAESRAVSDRGSDVGDDTREGSPAQHDPEARVRERLRDELPGSGAHLEARVNAILAMRDELKRFGEATRDDLLEVVDADDVGYSDRNSFWKNCVAGRDSLRSLENVERPPTGRATWRWIRN